MNPTVGLPTIKCVVVGDGGAGKTCLLSTYVNNSFPTDYVPTVFDNYDTNITVDGSSYLLQLWDTAGQEDYDKLRPLSYPQTDVFLLCFSIGNEPSFRNVVDKWMPELQRYSPKTRVILVGTKGDLREDRDFMAHLALHGQQPITREEATEVARRVGAAKFIECSALRRINLIQVFEDAVRIVKNPDCFNKRQKKKGKSNRNSCFIL